MPLPANISYVNKDYASIRDSILKQLGIITQGRYTNLNESDPSVAMLELYISMVDNLLFYQDMMVQELYLPTARQRRNVINLLRLIGYDFRGTAAALSNIKVKVKENTYPIYPVYVKKGAQFAAVSSLTSDQIIFTTTQDAQITSAADEKLIPVIQGTYTTEVFTSDGSANFKLRLSSEKVEKESIIVKVDTSGLGVSSLSSWIPVESFYNTTSEDLVYKIQVDEFSKVSILFGDGTFGHIPEAQAKIYVEYITTKGSDGNVGINAITDVISTYPYIYDSVSKAAQIVVVSSDAAAGGEDIESIEEAKEAALGQLLSQNRAVTREDFKYLVEAIEGVDKAIAWGENEEENPDYRLMNLVRVALFSEQFLDMYWNPASMSSYKNLRDNIVKKILLEKIPITTRISFVDPVLVDIFISVQIGVDISKYDPTIICDNVKTALLSLYSFENVTFGEDVRISDIHRTASSVEGVSWAKVNRLHTTPAGALPDTAIVPPVDLILEKWKLPVVTDVSLNPALTEVTAPATVPYIKITLPALFNIGLNSITVINPDDQNDVESNAFTCYPSYNIQHVTVTYSDAYDGPNAAGGFYGLPSGLNDTYIFTANR